MNKEKFLRLLSEKFSGTINADKLRSFDRAVAGNGEYGRLYSRLWPYLGSRRHVQPRKAQLDRVWEQIEMAEKQEFSGKYDYSQPRSLRAGLLMLSKIAAILFLSGAVCFFGYTYLHSNAARLPERVAAGNETVACTLDDGTRVWLNRNSVIRFNDAFGKNRREISLEGEAYFDVVHSQRIPLVVHAGSIDIEVKGTAFNVSSYGNSAPVQVALIRGSVKVTHTKGVRAAVLLKPNEKLVASGGRGQSVFSVSALKPEVLLREIGWTADTLVFHKEKLRDLAVRLEKKYGVEIQIRSEELKEKRFSGTITTETIQQVLEALKVSYPLTYTVRNRLVIIDALQ
ncbi:hypothetical protein C7T94_06725 [Pedobacter yulinensis]|uniref:Iron dicitrate transport regulator FecR n=1 Tax=Pedobacter yulinensis TaxID=2126353 RepID=A0A2T3HPP0_9SPHI|nr:FecR domain-containing protein [Pedobacter yulinensis]PST84396.1 hypothetical protein C7T94_06725 [Pedobacter yulinensis]